MQTIIGIFTDREDVETAITELTDRGFNPKDISIVMRDTSEADEISTDTGANIAGGAATGATTGAIIGGLAGLIAGVALPGLGAFLVGGPIAAALGLTGAAAATASGAATGAVAGGLLGALMSFGLSKEDATHYEERVKEGAILLAVPVDSSEAYIVRRIFEDNNVNDARSIQAPSEERKDERYADEHYRTEKTGERSGAHFGHVGAKGGRSRDKDRIAEEEEE